MITFSPISATMETEQPSAQQVSERHLTIGDTTVEHNWNKAVTVPLIRLKGLWLCEAGFGARNTITLRVEYGKITLFADPIPSRMVEETKQERRARLRKLRGNATMGKVTVTAEQVLAAKKVTA